MMLVTFALRAPPQNSSHRKAKRAEAAGEKVGNRRHRLESFPQRLTLISHAGGRFRRSKVHREGQETLTTAGQETGGTNCAASASGVR